MLPAWLIFSAGGTAHYLLTLSSCGLQFLVRADAAQPSLEMRRSWDGYR